MDKLPPKPPIQNATSEAIDELLSVEVLLERLRTLKVEHRQIDSQITALLEIGSVDMLKIGRLKKIKLSIKDKIARLEDQITPDIIA